MRAVVDTNVFVSGLLFGGKPQEVLESAVSGRVALFVSPTMVAELEGVLRRPRFGLTDQFVRAAIAEVTSLAEWVIPQARAEVVKDDPTDNEVIDCAVESRADCIVTGDGHLLRLREFQGIRIVDAAEFRLLEERGD